MPEKKSVVKPVTEKRLMNIALYYLERYESSSDNLRRLLQRRILRAGMEGTCIPEEAQTWVERIVAEVKRLGYVDDGRFARSLAEKCRKAGKSRKYICQKLTLAGIPSDLQAEVLSESGQDDETDAELQAALTLVRKRKLGAFRPEKERAGCRKKDLAALARAGFSYQTAVRALGESEQGEDEFVWD